MINCLCGKPLHYKDVELQERVEELVEMLGEYIPVRVSGSKIEYFVPRHYVALHGLKGCDLENLAQVYGLKRVDT